MAQKDDIYTPIVSVIEIVQQFEVRLRVKSGEKQSAIEKTKFFLPEKKANVNPFRHLAAEAKNER
jgi:hypothetical protein